MTEVPHNIEAEQALIGAVLVNNAVFDRVRLASEDFYDPLHGRIWSEVARRLIEGEAATPVLLKPVFDHDEGMAEVGGPAYLARLAGAAVSLREAPEYAKQIADLARRREIVLALERAQEAMRVNDDPEHVAAALEAEMMLVHDRARPQARSVSAMKAALDMIEAANEAYQSDGAAGVPTGVPELDRATGGMFPGELWVLGGRPSMGKTALALAFAMGSARGGRHVLFMSLEMPHQQLMARVASCIAHEGGQRVPYSQIRTGDMSEAQMRAAVEAARVATELPMTISPPQMRDLGAMMGEARAVERRLKAEDKSLGLIVVDYLQLIRTAHDKSYDRVSAAVKAMKEMAIRHECPVLCLSQLSRQVEQRENKRPVPSDLRDSGEIEQDADVILFAYRDEYYLAKEQPARGMSASIEKWHKAMDAVRGELEIIGSKFRQGAPTTVRCKIDVAVNRILPPEGAAQEGFDL